MDLFKLCVCVCVFNSDQHLPASVFAITPLSSGSEGGESGGGGARGGGWGGEGGILLKLIACLSGEPNRLNARL